MSIKQPADRSHFILPDLGEGVHEAELISWKVEVGQHLQEKRSVIRTQSQ